MTTPTTVFLLLGMLCLLGLSPFSLAGQSGGASHASAAEQLGPMDLPEGRLGRVLNRYYNEGMGGLSAYQRLESLRMEGDMEIGGRTFPFRIFKKKPDLFMLTMTLPGRNDWTMGYDGEVAWQQRPDLNDGKAVKMDEVQQARFLLDAAFASHLLYAKDPKKEINLIDTVPLDGRICHQIEVMFSSGYRLTYFIDTRTLHEYKVVIEDKNTGRLTEAFFDDYVKVGGMPMAREVTNFEEGEPVSILRIERIESNVGLMPWIFEMPE